MRRAGSTAMRPAHTCIRVAASLTCCRRPRSPVGGGVQTISGPNQIEGDPRDFSAVLHDGKFLVLNAAADQLLMRPSEQPGFIRRALKPIGAMKPLSTGQTDGKEPLHRGINPRDDQRTGSRDIGRRSMSQVWSQRKRWGGRPPGGIKCANVAGVETLLRGERP